ncbi:MAG: DUF512 domain-containing protein [Clostridia bacterium]|nr:DUF512 domain-containing protein [Clostridia bacterium]
MERPAAVSKVLSGSIAQEAGIETGDIVLAINGNKINDIFDYRFLTADEELVIEIEKSNGEVWEIEVEKDEYEDLGIEFSNPMLDEAKSCTNKCLFCFIDQLPKGMRKTLYFKDDDSRLSFLNGNYVTLTNVKDFELDRVIRYRMSPINISIHTTNPDLRIFMLHNRFAADILKKVKKLVNGGITVNCQIVLCRGINDEGELERTLKDLCLLHPGIHSVSVVPVGLTRHREGLMELKPYDGEASEEVIRQVEKWQHKMLVKHGTRVVYLADEFYILAGHELPEYEAYEDFPQIENGVGLIAALKKEFYDFIETADLPSCKARTVSIATGVSPAAFIRGLSQELENRIQGLKINIFEIKNCFFGENVTVTGLLTGSDLLSQLKGKALGQELLISRSMLRAGEDVLLDDCTVRDLESGLGVKVTAVDNSGKDFVKKVAGIEN